MTWFKRQKRPDRPSGVVLVSSGGLGDTVLLSLVVERFMKVAMRDESITLVLPRESTKMAFLFDQKITIFPVDYKVFRQSRSYVKNIADQLYSKHYRIVISTDFLRHPKLDEAVIKFCDSPETVAMEPRSWPKYNKALQTNKDRYSRCYNSGPDHMDKVLRWVGFANWLTGDVSPPPKVQLPERWAAPSAESYLKPTVFLVPFSAVKEKQSPPEIFLAVIEHLKGNYDFIIACAPNDIDENQEYLCLADADNISFDNSTFKDLAPKLKQAALVISVDTATMHLAVALGTPTVCMASAAYVNEITPYASEITPKNVRFVYQSMECEGCLGNCHLPPEGGRFPCITRIELQRILTNIDELLVR
jgi:ADP-heptose:LPS heptosyltransferase